MSQQATKPFLHHKRVPCLSFAHFRAFWWSLLSNIHSSLSKRRRETKSPLISPFQELFLPVFAKQSEKLICQKLLFLFNKVDFARKKYLCTQISVSWKEIEKFAKQISVYKSPNIILFALSTTDVSKEARYICVVASESCPIPSLITDNGTFFALAALAHE